MSSVKEVCNACPHKKVLLLTSAVGDNQAVLDAEGYAECPDCGARIHCGTVGIQNLEKRHRGSKTCLESKAKRDKNAKTKKNGTLFSFFNRPKPSLVPSTVPSVPLVQSPALPREKAPDTKPMAVAQNKIPPPSGLSLHEPPTSLPPVAEIQQADPESEEVVETSGRGRHKRAPRQIGDLNGCLCGMVVNFDVESNTAIECRQPGCETRWVSSTISQTEL
jgi:hypothetical protein